MSGCVKLYTDGSCNNAHPQGMGMGIYFLDSEEQFYIARCEEINGKATSNIAEYLALLQGLILIENLWRDYPNIEVYSDSQVLVEGVLGGYKLKDSILIKIKGAILAQHRKLNVPMTLTWIPREQNKIADKLSKQALLCDPSTYEMQRITL